MQLLKVAFLYWGIKNITANFTGCNGIYICPSTFSRIRISYKMELILDLGERRLLLPSKSVFPSIRTNNCSYFFSTTSTHGARCANKIPHEPNRFVCFRHPAFKLIVFVSRVRQKSPFPYLTTFCVPNRSIEIVNAFRVLCQHCCTTHYCFPRTASKLPSPRF